LKFLLSGVRYPNNHKMKSVVDAWLEGHAYQFHFTGINSLAEK